MTKIDISKGALLIPVGLSHSGKTHFKHNFFEALHESDIPDHKFMAVNADSVRAMLSGRDDRTDHNREPMVWFLMKKMILQGLLQDKLVFVDATNLKAKYRRTLIALAQEAKVRAIALNFNTPVDVCCQRAIDDGEGDIFVPVIEKMERTMSRPSVKEGFDEIHDVEDVKFISSNGFRYSYMEDYSEDGIPRTA